VCLCVCAGGAYVERVSVATQHSDVDAGQAVSSMGIFSTTFARERDHDSLPKTVISSDSIAVCKSRLKTFLFSQALSSFSAH